MSQDAFLDEMPRRSVSTVWVSGGCTSYYRKAGLHPNWSYEYGYGTREFDAGRHHTAGRDGRALGETWCTPHRMPTRGSRSQRRTATPLGLRD
jgi:hypothetical protein